MSNTPESSGMPETRPALVRPAWVLRVAANLLSAALRQMGYRVQVEPGLGARIRVLSILARLVILAVSAAAVVQIARTIPKREVPTPPPPPRVNVEAQDVVARPEVVEGIRLPGVVEARRVVIVSAEVAGHVEAVPAVEGRPCKPGDLIVRLNRELFEAEHERAKAQLAFSQAELGRVEQLAGRQVLTEKELDAARNQVVAAQSALRMARYNLERADIAAPIAGVLNKVTVEKGEYLQAGRAVAEIVEVDTVKVVAQLPERDVRFIKVGDAADVTDDAGDGRSRRQGQATYISELADSQTRTTRTEITLDNRDRKLKSGQIVQVEMARQRLRGVIMIPLAAVIPLEESYAVYVAEGDKAQRRDVKLGFLKGREVQVTDGLKPGDRLIVAGHRLVGPGQDIRIVEAVGSNASAKAAP